MHMHDYKTSKDRYWEATKNYKLEFIMFRIGNLSFLTFALARDGCFLNPARMGDVQNVGIETEVNAHVALRQLLLRGK